MYYEKCIVVLLLVRGEQNPEAFWLCIDHAKPAIWGKHIGFFLI